MEQKEESANPRAGQWGPSSQKSREKDNEKEWRQIRDLHGPKNALEGSPK